MVHPAKSTKGIQPPEGVGTVTHARLLQRREDNLSAIHTNLLKSYIKSASPYASSLSGIRAFSLSDHRMWGTLHYMLMFLLSTDEARGGAHNDTTTLQRCRCGCVHYHNPYSRTVMAHVDYSFLRYG